jgi:hypothetical protein
MEFREFRWVEHDAGNLFFQVVFKLVRVLFHSVMGFKSLIELAMVVLDNNFNFS